MKYGNLTLGQIEAGINKIGGEDAFMRLLAGELNIVPAEPKKLLEFVTTTSVAAVESFKASDNFKVDTKKTAVRIAWIGDNFKEYFLDKIEGASEAADIKVHKLLRTARDLPKNDEPGIIPELADQHEITLGQLFSLLQKQGKGETGSLLVNEYANIAYIRDINGILWAVSARWNSRSVGWLVEADSVEYPDGWRGGRQVFSR